jgi:bZIP transcription factor
MLSSASAGRSLADLGDEEDEEEDAESRTRRRLAQNREAARKSRQRRKQYVGRLEAEVGSPDLLSGRI